MDSYEIEQDLESIWLGIDFGTSNSCVAIWRKDRPGVKVFKSEQNVKIIPSTLLFGKGFEDVRVGVDTSYQENEADEYRVIGYIKPILGRKKISDVHLGEHLHLHQHKDALYVECEDEEGSERLLSPLQLTTHILSYLRKTAVEYIVQHPHILGDVCQHVEIKGAKGNKAKADSQSVSAPSSSKKKATIDLDVYVKNVVLGVPANYAQTYKDALAEAAKRAGFDEVHFMVESTAAALAYGLLLSPSPRTVMVFDMGGGTTDLTTLTLNPSSATSSTSKKYTILKSGGVGNIGGRVLDYLLFNYLLRTYLLPLGYVPKIEGEQEELDVLANNEDYMENKAYHSEEDQGSSSKRAYNLWKGLLLRACKKAKETLTQFEEVTLTLPNTILSSHSTSIADNLPSGVRLLESGDLEISLTRKQFEEAIVGAVGLVEGVVYSHLMSVLYPSDSPVSNSSESTSNSNPYAVDEASVNHTSNNPASPLTPPTPSSYMHASSRSISQSVCPATTALPLHEIVLVGGCSRIPCIQAAILRACHRAGIGMAIDPKKEDCSASANMHENPPGRPFTSPSSLCTMQDPETVVVMGLAIQAQRMASKMQPHMHGNTNADISNSGKNMSPSLQSLMMLQDFLVFDCIPRTLGIMLVKNNDGKQENQFVAMVKGGTRLPVTVKHVFKLAHPLQRIVTLDIYEEVVDDDMVEGTDIAHKEENRPAMHMFFTTVDVPVIRLADKSSREASNRDVYVEVVFHINEEQALTYEAYELPLGSNNKTTNAVASTCTQVLHMRGEDQESIRMMRMLCMYIVGLALLYVIGKVVISRNGVNDNVEEVFSGGDLGSIAEVEGATSDTDAPNGWYAVICAMYQLCWADAARWYNSYMGVDSPSGVR
eukprot:gene34719-42043_t